MRITVTSTNSIILGYAVVLYLALLIKKCSGSPYVISDDRVRSLDISPTLGRGYSIATNSFHSTCLMVDQTTVPSYNYDYYFTDFTRETDSEVALAGKISGSFGYFGVRGEFAASGSYNSKSQSKTHIVVATMRIERYYSSVKEEVSPLSDDAIEILSEQDYVGFFKACGPNYVRSIRRAQEVTAIFKFYSSSSSVARDFASRLKVSGWGSRIDASFAGSSKYKSVTSSLTIKIIGFGMGLKEDGSDTLVATSLDEYNEVMKFAFKSMTQSENSPHIGMVYGMEVVPWVHNSAFQVASKLLDDPVQVPLPKSVIPKAMAIGEGTDTEYECKNPGYEVDKKNRCCEPSAMYDWTTQTYSTTLIKEARTCRPERNLDPSIVKNNMSGNGEFVALLDSLVRYRMNQLFTLQKCVSAVRSIPDRYKFYILKAADSVKYDRAIETKFTVLELRMAIDPLNDFSLVKHMGQELDEFLDMYYQPCIAALFGMNTGLNSDTEARYFVSYPWQKHDECVKLSCLADNMRWDRKDGGCVPSLINGAGDYSGNDGDNTECTLDEDEDDDVCKYKSTDLKAFQDSAEGCWGGKNTVVPTYLMSYFCMPQITGEKADDDTIATLETREKNCISTSGGTGSSTSGTDTTATGADSSTTNS